MYSKCCHISLKWFIYSLASYIFLLSLLKREIAKAKKKNSKNSYSEQTGIVYLWYVIFFFLFPVWFFPKEISHTRYQCGLALILWASDSKRSSVLGFVSQLTEEEIWNLKRNSDYHLGLCRGSLIADSNGHFNEIYNPRMSIRSPAEILLTHSN